MSPNTFCLQHISSPTTVTNIDVIQNHLSHVFLRISYYSQDVLKIYKFIFSAFIYLLYSSNQTSNWDKYVERTSIPRDSSKSDHEKIEELIEEVEVRYFKWLKSTVVVQVKYLKWNSLSEVVQVMYFTWISSSEVI